MPRKRPASGTVVLLPAIYNETLTLLASAHEYFSARAEPEQRAHDERERIMYASEMSRITVRLSSVMAWLMARKAVLAGKIGGEEARARYPLECRDVCLGQNIEAESLLPEEMTDLLDRSLELYLRVARLEAAP